MEAILNEEMTSQQTGPALQLKRTLLPIEEYSTRQGLSQEIIEECGKLGIVQVRKYKGKTFVVDVPLSPYQSCGKPLQLVNRSTAVERRPELIRTTVVRPSKVAGKSAAATDKITRMKSSPNAVRTPDLETSEITTEFPLHIGDITETKGTFKSAASPKEDDLRSDIPAEQARPKRNWQITAVLSLIFLSAAVFVNLWLYVDWKIQTGNFEQAYTTIQKMRSNFTEADRQAETLRNEMNSSATELENLQNKLDMSNAEVKNLQDELKRARQNLETLKHRNSETGERLNKQIQELTTRLSELNQSLGSGV